MKQRIPFQLEHILQDGAYSDSNGIYGLNCFEYTFWQLMRQAGIKHYYAALHTRAFITEPRQLHRLMPIRTIAGNLAQLEKNAKQYCGFIRSACRSADQDIPLHTFIKDNISKGRFVYILYNNYFNTINNVTYRPPLREYHSTLLTGYDDENREYIPLIDGIYNVGYEDLTRMNRNFKQEGEWLYDWSVFVLKKQKQEVHLPDQEKYGQLVRVDLSMAIDDWNTESGIFLRGAEQLKDSFPGSRTELNSREIQKLEKISIIFRNSRLGFHGNLYLKLMALKEATGIDPRDFYEKFYAGTREYKRISNALLRLTIDYDYEKLCQAADEIVRIFVTDAEKLREELFRLMIEK